MSDNIRMLPGGSQSTPATVLRDTANKYGDDMRDVCIFWLSKETNKPVLIMTTGKLGHACVFAQVAQEAAGMALRGQLGG